MKRLILISLICCSGLPSVVQAALYRYDFIVTDVAGSMYTLPYYTGSYLDLTAPSGSMVDSSVAIADWHLVTGQGVLDISSSVRADYGGSPTLSWDNSTITSVAGTLVY